MDKMNVNEEANPAVENEHVEIEDTTKQQEDQSVVTDEQSVDVKVTDSLEALQKEYDKLSDSHLRLMAEFDNYRKRTLKEKSELIKSGGEGIVCNMLPVIDDFERAMQNIRSTEDVDALAEGVELIYNKFISFLAQQGVKPIEAVGKTFDTECFEAIATIPAPEEDLKGKILDCVQTGYIMHEKVIRHAKVVVGE